MSYTRRLRELEKVMHIPCSTMDLLGMHPAAQEQLGIAIDHFMAIEKHAKQLAAAVQPGVGAIKRLESRELHESLTAAVVALARDETCGRYVAKELKDLVVNYAPRHDMAFWNEQWPGHIHGLLAYEEPVQKGLEAEGVLVWYVEPDQQWRVVNSRWLEAHADIRRWVTQEWPGGRVCRFCGMQENPAVNALLPVDLERRRGVNVVGDVVMLPTGALTHDQCRVHWVKWLELAYLYPTQEAAEAADEAAGRKPRGKPVQTPAIELQPPRAEPSDE